MRGDGQAHRLAPAAGDEQEVVERPAGGGLHHAQVGRPDGVRVVAPEGAPGLARGAGGSKVPGRVGFGVRRTERLLTAMPGSGNSPRMRSVSRSGLSRENQAMRRCTSRLGRGPPPAAWERHRQYRRQPARCHRTTVSDVTTTRSRRRAGRSRRMSPQGSFSSRRKRARGRRRVGRVSTASWCRGRRFSSSSPRRRQAARAAARVSHSTSRIPEASPAERPCDTRADLPSHRTRGRRRVGRVSTASWWRSNRFSVIRSPRWRPAARTAASSRTIHSSM